MSTTESSKSDPLASLEDMSIKDKNISKSGDSDSVAASLEDFDLGTSVDEKGQAEGDEVHKKTAEPPRGATAKTDAVSASGMDSGLGSSEDGKGGLKLKGAKHKSVSWQYKQTIPTSGRDRVEACQMISPNHLAISGLGSVKVYDVSTERSHLVYTVSIKVWKGYWISGVAVSESLPSSMLVICREHPNVYQCPCHRATKVIKKYRIASNMKDPWCIVANADSVIIRMFGGKSFIVCRLPDFTQQSCVQIDFSPWDLSISPDYLVIMGTKEMEVRSLSEAKQDVCRIKPPEGWEFISVCCGNNAREIYAACKQGDRHNEKGSVYRYAWGGIIGEAKYGNPTCIIESLGRVGSKGLSVTSDRLLAVGYGYTKVKIYKLQ